MKTVVAVRHLAFEDLGLIEPWLLRRSWRVEYRDAGVDDLRGPEFDEADLLVVLGGPIGAEDEDHAVLLRDEVELIRRRLRGERPLLGICLGAQLIARALGARVRSMGRKEIGYAPLSLAPEAHATALRHLGDVPVLHWHGDQFDCPTGITAIASTDACARQAFMVGDHAMAWQFHLEVDARRIEQWLIGHTLELAQGAISKDTLRRQAVANRDALERALDAVLSDWFCRLGLA
jgi:GMP synthase (glutamine-hydrolysing)